MTPAEVISQEMIAVPVSGDLRLAVLGSPEYLSTHGTLQHPRDLTYHECINWSPSPDGPAYRWEFTGAGRHFAVSVDARVATTDPELNLQLAIAGIGLTKLFDGNKRERIAEGLLVEVLAEFSSAFAGFHLYYPRRRNRPAPLRALIDFVRSRVGADGPLRI